MVTPSAFAVLRLILEFGRLLDRLALLRIFHRAKRSLRSVSKACGIAV
jgi:hypothetical protein